MKKRLTCEIEIDAAKNVSVKIPPLAVESLADVYISNYLNENLESAIAELVGQMIGDEINASASVGKKREQILRRVRNESEKNVRERVKKSQGLVLPQELLEDKHLLKIDLKSVRQNYLENKKSAVFAFMNDFMDAYRKNESERKPPTKTNIANRMFERHSNPNLMLSRELKKIGFAFDEILIAIQE